MAKDTVINHLVLIDGYRKDSTNRVMYDFYDAVAGRHYNTTLGSSRYVFSVIKGLKK